MYLPLYHSALPHPNSYAFTHRRLPPGVRVKQSTASLLPKPPFHLTITHLTRTPTRLRRAATLTPLPPAPQRLPRQPYCASSPQLSARFPLRVRHSAPTAADLASQRTLLQKPIPRFRDLHLMASSPPTNPPTRTRTQVRRHPAATVTVLSCRRHVPGPLLPPRPPIRAHPPHSALADHSARDFLTTLHRHGAGHYPLSHCGEQQQAWYSRAPLAQGRRLQGQEQGASWLPRLCRSPDLLLMSTCAPCSPHRPDLLLMSTCAPSSSHPTHLMHCSSRRHTIFAPRIHITLPLPLLFVFSTSQSNRRPSSPFQSLAGSPCHPQP